MRPSLALLAKLGSLVVHLQGAEIGECVTTADAVAIRALLADPEIEAWLAEMQKFGLVPVKR
jgi:hypothetical protein